MVDSDSDAISYVDYPSTDDDTYDSDVGQDTNSILMLDLDLLLKRQWSRKHIRPRPNCTECLFCLNPLRYTQPAVFCTNCGVCHHSKCWYEYTRYKQICPVCKASHTIQIVSIEDAAGESGCSLHQDATLARCGKCTT